MPLVHQIYEADATVAALATPPGEGGIAVIRLSGPEAIAVADKIFTGSVQSYSSHTVHYGYICDQKGRRIDQVLLTVMHAPKTYTGEDTVEISCHGGSLITRKVLEEILAAGARAALPGEFTFKAFIHGKIDLTQAEAVQELIAAKNEHALSAAENHLEGKLSRLVSSFQKDLNGIAAILEAWVDFPEEGLEFATVEQICKELISVKKRMKQLLNTFHDGKIIHEGLSLCLVGSPNVGKSSLMNAFLDKERAIVSSTPGTTRDVVEDSLRINGLNFRIVDTAGIRDAYEEVEKEGIRRSKKAMKEADLVLFVLDASQGIGDQELALLASLPPEKTIAIWNKIDLKNNGMSKLSFPYVVEVSAKERQGLSALHDMIDRVIWHHGPPSREEVVITNLRHKESLLEAIDACKSLIEGLQEEVSPEFLTLEVRSCLGALGKMIGTDITEDILSAIFSRFCVGK